jgi:hypothetical protein
MKVTVLQTLFEGGGATHPFSRQPKNGQNAKDEKLQMKTMSRSGTAEIDLGRMFTFS